MLQHPIRHVARRPTVPNPGAVLPAFALGGMQDPFEIVLRHTGRTLAKHILSSNMREYRKWSS